MFNFHFHNSVGFLIAFIPALMNLGIVGYIFWKLPENRLTSVFALLSLALACWQINDSITRISPSGQITDTWDIIFCASWLFVGPLCLHFALLYTSILKQKRSRTTLLLLYVPAIVFTLLYQARVYSHIYTYENIWGWVNYHDKHWIDVLQIYWISVLVIAATIIIFYHAYIIRKDLLLIKQTIIIATGIGIPTVMGLVGQVIMPLILNKPAIPFASTFMTFFSLATVLSLNKYRLFNASDTVSNEKLIEDMPLMIFSISEKRRLAYINNYTAEMLKINKYELGILPLKKLLPFASVEHSNLFFESYVSAMRGETINNFESNIITPDGEKDLVISCKPIINNKQVQGVLFAARDITALKKSNELIKHKEMLLADAQEIAHVGSWEWSVKENAVLWSDELYRIFGYDPGSENIDYTRFMELVHPEDKQRVEGIVMNSFTTLEPFTYYARIIKKDNSIVNIHARGKVMTNEHNEVIKLIGTAQDVTEQKLKEETLQRQNEELRKINHELDKFVYSVSHDLRAPLLSMQGVIDITTEITREEIIIEHMDMLKTSITRLDSFIEDILDYSRNARGELNIQPVDFNKLLKVITDDIKHITTNNRMVQIEFETLSEGVFCTDKNRLSVVLTNLISNAIRYHNRDSRNSFVKIHVNANEVNAIIEVEDNGIGINPVNQEKIFEMFYRVSENSTGSGLGLYIVKEAVNRLKGKIKITSTEGHGSKFTVEIPNLLYQ